MSSRVRNILSWIQAFGFDPFATRSAFRNLRTTIQEYNRFRKQNSVGEARWSLTFSSPVFNDRSETSGVASGHYFHQDLFVARRIFERNPKRHVDVGSRIDGFVAHVATFRRIEVFDIRPMNSRVQNVEFKQLDLMNPGDTYLDYCDSLSCLHALEHFGLGRYGDQIDSNGYKSGFESIARMLKSDGILYLSVPIGRERVEFNAQRVFSVRRLVELFGDAFRPIGFSYIDDAGELHQGADLESMISGGDEELAYGCGIFELLKVGKHDSFPLPV